MKKSEIIIKRNNIEDAIYVSQNIPEFKDTYLINEYENRLNNTKYLIITAYINHQPVGFIIGYESQSKQNFYSWMGGVLPKYRQLGIAEKLINYQKQWAMKAGYQRLLMKTRNKHKAMINLLHKYRFLKIGIIPHYPDEETRILYEKKLKLF